MKITNTAIRYRTTVVVLTVLLALGGLYSYLTIPKESRPSIEIPNIVVTTLYPGASPDDVESLVTQEIEQEIEGINGINQIESTSTEGVSTIIVEFTPDIAMDKAYQDIRDQVDIAKADLPEDVEEPMVNEIDISEFPIMTVNLSANYSLARLKEVAEDVQEELEAIPSILEANLVGGLTREVQVEVDLNALQSYNLTFGDLVSTIQQENTNLPGGSIDVDRLNYLVRVNGTFDDPREIENLVLSAPEGQPIYVRDVADVTFGFRDRESYARLQVLNEETEEGEFVPVPPSESQMMQVISLNVTKRSGDNIIDASNRVKEVVNEFPFPSGTQVTVTGDESENVQALVTDLENNIISGLIFVVAVLLFFMGVRNATLVGIAIPLSMFVSFLVFQAMGQTFNFIILFSLIIALGMLVDNAVVIVENIYRFREQGYSRFDAARLGTAEVAGPVIGATATTVLAFVPMLFWPGVVGKFMSFLPMTLIITLTSSLFVALLINPVITGIFVKLDRPDEQTDGQPRPKAVRYAATAAIVATALVIALANWKTLVVIAVAVPVLYYVHTRVFKPVGDEFVKTGLPRLIDRYRTFIEWMLTRDYSGRRAMVYNTWALGAFTVGAALALLGGVIAGALGTVPAMILLIPGGLLAAAGLFGILFHTMESLFLGGRSTVRFGLGLAGLIVVLVGFILLTKSLAFAIMIELMILPVLITLIGLHGAAHKRPYRFVRLLDDALVVLAGAMVVGAAIGLVGLVVSPLLGADIGIGSETFVPMLGLLVPAFFVGSLGYLGRTYLRREGGPLFQTDNRARLLTTAIASLFAILALFAAAPTGMAFFPESDPARIQIALDAAVGTNIETSNDIAREAENRISSLLENNAESRANVRNELVNVGVGGDAMFGGGAQQASRSQITLNMVDFAEREEASTETLRKLRQQMQGIPGVDLEFTQNQQGPPTGPPVNIEIAGEDFEQIVDISREVKDLLQQGVESGALPGLVDITDNLNTGRPELRVDIDRERAAQFGLNTSMIANTVRSAINGIEASTYRTGEDEYDIRVRLREEDRRNLESLNNLTLLLPGGEDGPQQIPLVSVADLRTTTGFGSITRIGLERVVTVEGDAAPGYNGPEVLGRVQEYLSDYRQTLPSGYTMEYTGGNQDQQESFGFLTTALLVGIALIFLVLIAQFNSISAPFMIMVAVGLSLIGVLLGLILTRTPFSLFTFIGVISLAGIVVNNNIVLIDYIIQLRHRGLSKREAIIEGGATRLRPVLLTALTTILGLIPLTFGINVDFVGLLTDFAPDFQFGSENTQFWGPMGTAIISGLTFATFLTLVIVPVMYSAFDSLSMRMTALFGGDAGDGSIVTDAVGSSEEGLADAPAGTALSGGNGHPEAGEELESTAK